MALPRYRFEVHYQADDDHHAVIDGLTGEPIAFVPDITVVEKITKALNAFDKPAPCSACGFDPSDIVV